MRTKNPLQWTWMMRVDGLFKSCQSAPSIAGLSSRRSDGRDIVTKQEWIGKINGILPAPPQAYILRSPPALPAGGHTLPKVCKRGQRGTSSPSEAHRNKGWSGAVRLAMRLDTRRRMRYRRAPRGMWEEDLGNTSWEMLGERGLIRQT